MICPPDGPARPTRSAAALVLLIAGLLIGTALASPGRAAAPAPLVARDGLVVSGNPQASLVGARVLQAGGTAVDAAVAVHFALAVTHPEAGNLGGGGFMIVRLADGTCEAIDFREVAPAAATRDLYLGPDGRPDRALSTASLLAVGVPGSVAGMGLAHERFGTVAWDELLAPAVRLARAGFALDAYLAGGLRRSAERLGRHPEARRIFLREGDYFAPGDTLRQPELAATLARIALHGPAEFYQGETADSLIREMERGGGIMTREDLRAYRPLIREPLRGRDGGHEILTMPPPSSGGVALVQMLQMLAGVPLDVYGAGSSRSCHYLAEAMRRAFADRAEFLGDPEFAPIPVVGLTAASYAESLAATIDPWRATPSLEAGPGLPHGARAFYAATGGSPGPDIRTSSGGTETTHFSIVDAEGNAVAVTTTLNTSYGTGLMATGAGFLLNNELDDFAALPGTPNYYGLIQGEANAVRPFARPLSSMTPAIVVVDGEVRLVLGSPGGPRIITSVLQVYLNVTRHEMDVQAAVAAPRIHHQWWPDRLYHESDALVTDVARALEQLGHTLAPRGAIGSVQAVEVRRNQDGERLLLGGADPRRNGCAVGVSGERIVSRCACP